MRRHRNRRRSRPFRLTRGPPGRIVTGVNAEPAKHRFFAPEMAPPEATLTANEAHHALHVLRLGIGEVVELFDGCGRRAVGPIVRIRRDAVIVAVEKVPEPIARPGPHVDLAFAPPTRKRLDWLLEKATELGVRTLRPIRRGGEKIMADTASAEKHWRGILAGAARQSGQVYLPELLGPAALADVLAERGDALGVLADTDPACPPLSRLFDPPPERVFLLVGPAGGWTDSERQAARDAGFRPGRLGETTLRAETAALALTAAAIALCRPTR